MHLVLSWLVLQKSLVVQIFLLLFYIKIAYFVGERIELFIGIFISMKSTFPFEPEGSKKMVKHQNLSRKNKTKQRKLTSNNKNNNKRIRMF